MGIGPAPEGVAADAGQAVDGAISASLGKPANAAQNEL
ncbi:hypothetical protein RGE_11850 [Rubrivivax gelatinosus IL144]|uniref:Uncharacterized protein n=1 Tax=Rubrivivax gelatinosus (strain NBRC 100245 / IL144) TaxID=983917 RepID=I0HND9_RUBGI|nr:hypothetical protein RGE_11850 [Rubrivivax gelatinosus IL144]